MRFEGEVRPWGTFTQYVHNEPARAEILRVAPGSTVSATDIGSAPEGYLYVVLMGTVHFRSAAGDQRLIPGSRIVFAADQEHSLEAASQLQLLVIRRGVGEPCTVKTIDVNPQSSLSLQYHKLRDETWLVYDGRGAVVMGSLSDDGEPEHLQDRPAMPGAEFHVPRGTVHRMKTGAMPLRLVEIAHGEFREVEDNYRLEDAYGRENEAVV